MTARFNNVVILAQFCAELVRQGITFEVSQVFGGDYLVTFTGGY